MWIDIDKLNSGYCCSHYCSQNAVIFDEFEIPIGILGINSYLGIVVEITTKLTEEDMKPIITNLMVSYLNNIKGMKHLDVKEYVETINILLKDVTTGDIKNVF